MNKQVCVLTSVHYPYDTRIFNKQVQSLASYGFSVRLVARGERDPSIQVPENVKIQLLPEPKNRILRFAGLIPLLRTALQTDADVYHLHDPELLPFVPVFKNQTSASVVYDVHEDVRSQIGKKSWIPAPLKSGIRGCFDITERSILPLIDAVILAEDGYKSIPIYQDCNVVRNYPKLDAAIESRAIEQLDRQRGENEPIRLVYLGGISRARGAQELVKLVDEIHSEHDLSFTFIGEFQSKEFEKTILNQVRNKGVESVIEFTGRLPFDEAMQRLLTADIGYAILHKEPNFIDSLPTKLFEYMMCGLPVIISDVDKWEHIVTEHDCGIAVSPTDIDEITTQTETLITSAQERLRLGRNGLEAIKNKFRWKNEEQTLLRVYDNL